MKRGKNENRILLNKKLLELIAMKKRLTFLLLIFVCGTFTLSAQDKFDFGKDFLKVNTKSTQTQQHKEDKKLLKLYPVPATRQINFKLKSNPYNKTYEIKIYNFLGKAVDKITGFSDNKTLNLKDYYSGIYIYQLRDKQGHLVESGKFNVVK